MHVKNRKMIHRAVLATVCCSAFVAGCEPLGFFGPNLGINLIVPLGLNGNPGVLNPFGIVQALVNTAITSGGSATGPAAGTAPDGPGGLDGGVIVGVL